MIVMHFRYIYVVNIGAEEIQVHERQADGALKQIQVHILYFMFPCHISINALSHVYSNINLSLYFHHYLIVIRSIYLIMYSTGYSFFHIPNNHIQSSINVILHKIWDHTLPVKYKVLCCGSFASWKVWHFNFPPKLWHHRVWWTTEWMQHLYHICGI